MLFRLWTLLVAATLVVATTHAPAPAPLAVETVEVGEQLGELDDSLVVVIDLETVPIAGHALLPPRTLGIPAAPPPAAIFRPPRLAS